VAGNEEIFRKLMNQGHSEAWDQAWDRAADYYRQALVEIPDHPQALINLGLAMFELHSFEDALQYYLRAAQVSPDDPIPLEKAADIYERMGVLNKAGEISLQAAEIFAKNRDMKKAIGCWTRVTAHNPENVMAHSRLALVYEHLGRNEASVEEYIALASLLQHTGQVDKAIQAVNHALELVPGSKETAHALAQLKAKRLLPKPLPKRGGTGPLRMSQIRKLEAARGGQTKSPDPIVEARQNALRVIAGMLFDLTEGKKVSEAEAQGIQTRVLRAFSKETVESTSVKVDKVRVITHLGQVVDFQTRGKDKEAADELEKAADAGIDHPALFYDLGLLLSKGERTQSAIRSLKRALPSKEFSLAANLLLGQIQYKMGRIKEAGMHYLEALRLADAQVVPHAFADDLRQLYEPLIDALSREKNEKIHNQLCQNIEDLLGRPDWREYLKQARQQLPDPETGGLLAPLAEILTTADSGRLVRSIAYIRSLAEQGHWRSAMEEAFWTLQEASAYLPLHTYMSDLLIQQGFIDEAIAKLAVVAQAYKVRGENKRAVDVFKRMIEIYPMDLNAHERLIQELIAGNEIEVAVRETMSMANIYYDMADLNKARQTYTEALRLAQQSNLDVSQKVNILHQMADLDVQSLDWRQALVVYKQIRTLSPSDEKANAKLVDLNLRLGQQSQAGAELDQYLAYVVENLNTEMALSFIKRMVEDHPEQDFIRKRLVELFRQAGRAEEAIDHLDRLADQLVNAEEKKIAIKVLQSILDLKPSNAEQYRQLLNEFSVE
jgi:tetratricopeptide (TPR) repeat protein